MHFLLLKQAKNTSMTTMNELMITGAPDETEEYAAQIAAHLSGGQILNLSGDLGSGKTTFVRGLAEGLGADPREVSSPSYTLVNVYEGDMRLVHADLYRLGDESEITELGLEDLFNDDTVVVVEWGERMPNSIRCDINIHFEVAGDTKRRITIKK